MTTIPICLNCKHLKSSDESFKLSCKAFPRGIPEIIISGEFNHKKPHPKDNGIQYKEDKI